jgi:hypothetical protein
MSDATAPRELRVAGIFAIRTPHRRKSVDHNLRFANLPRELYLTLFPGGKSAARLAVRQVRRLDSKTTSILADPVSRLSDRAFEFLRREEPILEFAL